MYQYIIDSALVPLSGAAAPDACVLTILTSEELSHRPQLPGLEQMLAHTPLARDARVCKAESYGSYLSGTIHTPRRTKEQIPIAFGFLLTKAQMVLCDDSGVGHTLLRQIGRGHPLRETGAANFFCAFLESLIAKDMHHLQELEDALEEMEEQIPTGEPKHINAQLSALRREIAGWIRYYTQLAGFAAELQENRCDFFREAEVHWLHLIEKRVERLLGAAQGLREYGMQIRELFQGEIDIRQNSIMKILTIVTTIFLPLTLITGWYGMNFSGMPELTWRYGYIAVTVVSVLVVAICLYVMKKKRFW